METIIRNPGLYHLAEKVFWNLDFESLKICAQINSSCDQILQNPMFCLRKFSQHSKENHNDWINIIQSVGDSDKGIAIISYLQWLLKKRVLVEPPCYTSPAVQNEFRKKLWESCKKRELSNEDVEIVKIFVPLTYNLTTQDEAGWTLIHWAAMYRHTEIVKILALTGNPNVPNIHGETPIYRAACNGSTEIVKILAPLTDKPNAPNDYGDTPIYWA